MMCRVSASRPSCNARVRSRGEAVSVMAMTSVSSRDPKSWMIKGYR
jgi:hypothetical protein